MANEPESQSRYDPMFINANAVRTIPHPPGKRIGHSFIASSCWRKLRTVNCTVRDDYGSAAYLAHYLRRLLSADW